MDFKWGPFLAGMVIVLIVAAGSNCSQVELLGQRLAAIERRLGEGRD